MAIGRLWDTRSESVRWQRDQRTASYRALAEQFQALCEVLRALALTDPASEGYADRVDQVRLVDFKAWDTAYTAVWLYGTPTVVAVASDLDAAVTRLLYRVQDELHSIRQWERDREPARSIVQKYLDAVRSELRLPEVNARFFSRTPDIEPPDTRT